MEQYEILIIGGGPAGMMAAVSAAGQGAKGLLLERNSRLGRNLLITGKGRCNVTNNCGRDTLLNNIPRNPRFLYSAFAQFSPEDTMAFFESRGLPLKTERGNRVFPVSDKAADVERVWKPPSGTLARKSAPAGRNSYYWRTGRSKASCARTERNTGRTP